MLSAGKGSESLMEYWSVLPVVLYVKGVPYFLVTLSSKGLLRNQSFYDKMESGDNFLTKTEILVLWSEAAKPIVRLVKSAWKIYSWYDL